MPYRPTLSTIPGMIARIDAQQAQGQAQLDAQQVNGANPPPPAAPAPADPVPEPVVVEPTPEPARRICGALGRRSGKPCQCAPMANGRCDKHGGLSLSGIASPRFKHGRYSKYMPAGLRAKYKAALADPRLTSLKDELAIQTTRLNQLFERLDGAAVSLDALLAGIAEVRRAAEQGSGLPEAIDRLEQLATEGQAAQRREAAVWAEVRAVITEKTSTAAAEVRRRAQLKAYLPAEEAISFVEAALRAISDIVHDETQLRLLQRRMIELMPPPADE
jgi:hypothetical protein